MTTDSFPQTKRLPATVPLAVLLVAGALFSLAWIVLPIVAMVGPWGCHL